MQRCTSHLISSPYYSQHNLLTAPVDPHLLHSAALDHYYHFCDTISILPFLACCRVLCPRCCLHGGVVFPLRLSVMMSAPLVEVCAPSSYHYHSHHVPATSCRQAHNTRLSSAGTNVGCGRSIHPIHSLCCSASQYYSPTRSSAVCSTRSVPTWRTLHRPSPSRPCVVSSSAYADNRSACLLVQRPHSSHLVSLSL